MPVGSPGGTLDNDNPINLQIQPLWWRVTKWTAPALASAYPAVWTSNLAHRAAAAIYQNPDFENLVTYATVAGTLVAGTYILNRVLNYFEGQSRADHAERNAWERNQYDLTRGTDLSAARFRNDVIRQRGVN